MFSKQYSFDKFYMFICRLDTKKGVETIVGMRGDTLTEKGASP